MGEHALVFECEGSRLIGILHRPVGQPNTMGVVVVVGGPQYRVGSHRQFTLMARAFADAGYAVLRFDYRGMGDSQGNSHRFDGVDADIRCAIDTLLLAVPDIDRVVLWGLCDAASACLIYCNQRDLRVRGLVLANPWVRSAVGEAKVYLKHYYLQRFSQKTFWRKLFGGGFNPLRSAQELVSLSTKVVTGGGGPIGAGDGQGFVEGMQAGLKAFDCAILLLLSELDLTAKEFSDHFNSSPAWKESLRSRQIHREFLPGVDHTFSTEGGLSKVNQLCLQWMTSFEQAGCK